MFVDVLWEQVSHRKTSFVLNALQALDQVFFLIRTRLFCHSQGRYNNFKTCALRRNTASLNSFHYCRCACYGPYRDVLLSLFQLPCRAFTDGGGAIFAVGGSRFPHALQVFKGNCLFQNIRLYLFGLRSFSWSCLLAFPIAFLLAIEIPHSFSHAFLSWFWSFANIATLSAAHTHKQLIAIHKEMGGAARKYALAAAARAEGGVGSLEASEGEPTSQPTSRPGSALRRTGNSLYSDGEGDDSDWEERYYASSPEHSMFER